jgi:hypothetical protein
MTRPAALALAALATFGAGSTQALSLSPAPTSFFANGTVVLASKQSKIQCDISFKGQVNKQGVGKINTLFFSGDKGLCDATTADGLPWTVRASGPTLGKIIGFAFSGTFLGACGSGTVPFTDNPSGMWAISGTLPSGCSVNGVVNTTPAIVIVH